MPPGACVGSGRRRSARRRPSRRGAGTRSAAAAACRASIIVIRFEQQPLLLVRLRDRDLVRVDPVRLHVAGAGAVEEVVGADADDAVAFLAHPGRVALARVDDRARKVVGERGGLAAARADRAQRDGGVGRRRRRVRVQRRDRGRAVERVAVGGAVELDRLPTIPAPAPASCRPAGRRSRASCRRRSARAGRRAACPAASRSGCRRRSPSSKSVVTCAAVSGVSPSTTTSNCDSNAAESERHVERRERVQALVPQDLGQVRRERVDARRHDEHRRRGRLGRERPRRRRPQRVPGGVRRRRRRRPRTYGGVGRPVAAVRSAASASRRSSPRRR